MSWSNAKNKLDGVLLARNTPPRNDNSGDVTALNANKVLNSALDAKSKGDFETAKKLLGQLITAYESKKTVQGVVPAKKISEAYLAYAECLYWTGEPVRSVEYFNKTYDRIDNLSPWLAAEAYGEGGNAKASAAAVLEKGGDKAGAKALYEQAVDDLKTYFKYYGAHDGKIQYYTDWDIQVRVQQVNFALGWVLQYKLDRPKEAEPYYKAALEHYQGTGKAADGVSVGDIYFGLAQIYDFQYKDQETKALEHYRGAIEHYEKVKTDANAKPEAKAAATEKQSKAYLRVGELLAIRYLSGTDESGARLTEEKRNELLTKLVDNYFSRSQEPEAKLWTARIMSVTAGKDLKTLESAIKYLDDNMSVFQGSAYQEARLLHAEMLFMREILQNKGVSKPKYDFTEAQKDIDYVLQGSDDKTLTARAYVLKSKIDLAQGKTREAGEDLAGAKALRGEVPPYVQIEIDRTEESINKAVETGKTPTQTEEVNQFGYRPPVVTVGYSSNSGEQVVKDTGTGESKKVKQEIKGESVSVNIPLRKTENSTLNLTGRFFNGTFDTSPTMGHYINPVATAWDSEGNATSWRTEEQDLKLLETKSINNMQLGLSYFRHLDRFNFWVAPGIEQTNIGFTTYSPSWPGGYYDNFYNVSPNKTERNFSSTSASIRAHFELDDKALNAGALRIQPYVEGYYAYSQRNMASGYAPLDQDSLQYWRSLPENTPGRAKTIRELEDKLRNDPLNDYQIKIGSRFTYPWMVNGSQKAETSLDFNVGYGAMPASGSLGGFWPLNDAMTGPKLSPEIALTHTFTVGRMMFGLSGMYHQDISMSGGEGNGQYYGAEFFTRLNNVNLLGQGLDPELFVNYTASDSENNYSSNGTFIGIRLRGRP
jgi:hypothetical protein